MQVDCQDFLSTSLMRVVSTTCGKSENRDLKIAVYGKRLTSRNSYVINSKS